MNDEPKSLLPIAWPETVREAMRAIERPHSDLDGLCRSDTKAGRRHQARVSALENALYLSIATHGMEKRK